jgi:PknH-like extracellular domain
MSFRATASAIALTAAACLLLAPAAMASSRGPVQVTGKQLRAALLPASDFVSGYRVLTGNDSGRKLEHVSLFNLSSMKCEDFWTFIGTGYGFGDTAFATELVADKTGALNPAEIFNQSVYQFASTKAAASFYARVNAKYRSCHSLTGSDGSGGTLRRTVHSQSATRVGGHQATQTIEYVVDSKVPGPPLPVYLLWTIDGADVYFISTTPLSPGPPQPTQSSLTLELIARVTALR